MILIDPVQITDAMLISTNLPEADYAAWSSGTTYAAGDRVISTTTHKVYQSKAGGNLNHNPTTDTAGTYWGIVGATNRWKPFDNRLSDKATGTGTITYDIKPGSVCSGIALFGLTGETVTVSVTDSVDGLVYDETFALVDNGFVGDWWTWLYAPIRRTKELVIEDLPLYSTGTVTITVTDSAGGTVELGEVVLGYQWEIGDTKVNLGLGIADYSTKTVDDYGNVTLTEGRYASTVEYDIAIDAADIRNVQDLLASVRAKGAAYHDGPLGVSTGATVFGWFKDFSINLISRQPDGTGLAYVTIKIEGLV